MHKGLEKSFLRELYVAERRERKPRKEMFKGTLIFENYEIKGAFLCNKKFESRNLLMECVCFILVPLIVIVYLSTNIMTIDKTLFGMRSYYAGSLIITASAVVPFVADFERKRRNVRDLTLLATIIALNVAGRAAFFMFADFKPIFAVTIIAGLAMGSDAGFMVGAMTMLISNFMFGHGPWTVWQMLALGIIGFIAGIMAEHNLAPKKRGTLSFVGFFMAFIVYGGIMNLGAMFMSVGQPSISALIMYYISGIPVDVVKGIGTWLFLWIMGEPLLRKIHRVISE